MESSDGLSPDEQRAARGYLDFYNRAVAPVTGRVRTWQRLGIVLLIGAALVNVGCATMGGWDPHVDVACYVVVGAVLSAARLIWMAGRSEQAVFGLLDSWARQAREDLR